MSEPDWRREVASRLRAYRARRQRPNDSQDVLPFSDASPQHKPGVALIEGVSAETAIVDEDAAASRNASSRVERVAITVSQPASSFANEAEYSRTLRPGGTAVDRGALVPVADLRERQIAGLYDAAFLLLAYGGFLGLFGWLGGQFSFGKYDALVYAATLVLFYVQYFALFTFFGGATPGMLLRGLRVVSFDGTPPSPRQLLWRSFGYVVSGGTGFLGFLWALWDEDHLTWQDRVSQTYLASAGRREATTSLGTLQGTHHFAQK